MANDGSRVVSLDALEGQLTANIGNRLRAIGQGASFSAADEAEAAARAAFTGETYDEALENIRREYAQYVEENPYEATGLEFAGGVGATLIPVYGQAGRGLQAAAGISRLASPVARAAAIGTGAGALSGFGAGEGGFLNRAQTAGVGGVLGGVLGGALPIAGGGARNIYGALSSVLSPPSQGSATRMAQEVLDRYVVQTGRTYDELIEQAQRDAAMKVPTVLGQLSPELSKLSETVVLRPTPGARELTKAMTQTQIGAKGRVRSAVENVFPANSGYYYERQGMMEGLQDRAQSLYDVAYTAGGKVDDPLINNVLRDPDFASAYADAVQLARRLASTATLEGRDPSIYNLTRVYDVAFDAQGLPTGTRFVGELPDVRTLDFVKRTLDAKISSLYSGGKGAEAASLRDMRNAFVKRLDDIVPEYKVARGQYAGDMEIVNAMDKGLEYKSIPPEQLEDIFGGYTEGEQRAFKTGMLNSILRPSGASSGAGDWANRIIGPLDEKKRLQTILTPGEYNVIEAALSRESDIYSQTRGALTGSQTAGRQQAVESLNQTIDSTTNASDVADVIRNLGHGGLGAAAWYMLTKLPKVSVSATVYDRLARILSTGGPDEIAQALLEVRSAAETAAARGVRSTGRQERVATGLGAAIGPAPATEEQLQREEQFYAEPLPFTPPDLSAFRLPEEGEAAPVTPSPGVNAPDLSRFRMEGESP